MSKITVKTRMATVTFDNPTDAAEFVSALEKGGRGRARARPSQRSRSRASAAEDLKTAIRLLELIQRTPGTGLPSEALARELGLKGARGLPAIATPTKKALDRLNIPFEAAVRIERTVDGNYWRATKETENILIALRKEAERI